MLVCTLTTYAQTFFWGFACGAAGAIIMVYGSRNIWRRWV